MANTTNLDLEKPLGTDKALVARLNSNSDKIDAWAGTTNQALSNIKTATKTFYTTSDFDSLTSGFIDSVSFSNGTARANLPFSGQASLAINGGGSYIHLICTRANGEMYTRSKNNGTWDESWNQLALKSDMLKKQTVTIGDLTLTSGGFYNINSFIPSGKTIFMAQISYYSSASPAASFTVTSDGKYIIGTGGQVITGLKVDYYYY